MARQGTHKPAPDASPQRLATAMRLLHFIWVPIESGAPAVDPYRPFGSPDPWTDLAALAGTADEAALRGLYCGVMNELPTFVRAAAAKLAPGRYALDAESAARLRGFMPSDNPGVVGDDGFEYTAEHAAVLPRMAWRFCDAQGELVWDPFEPGQIEPAEDEWLLKEGGDPRTWPVMAVSDKRPYGERSYFELDMADALGIPQSGGEGGEPLPEAVLAQLGALHHTTATALRVVVLHGKA
jgi:hypothetical protein